MIIYIIIFFTAPSQCCVQAVKFFFFIYTGQHQILMEMALGVPKSIFDADLKHVLFVCLFVFF